MEDPPCPWVTQAHSSPEARNLPLKDRCLSRACPRASCTFSIRALQAPRGERTKSARCLMRYFLPPATATPNKPSKLSASTLNPSSLLISNRRCGPARLGAWFSLSSGNWGSSSELEASPGPREQVRGGGENSPSWAHKGPEVPTARPAEGQTLESPALLSAPTAPEPCSTAPILPKGPGVPFCGLPVKTPSDSLLHACLSIFIKDILENYIINLCFFVCSKSL